MILQAVLFQLVMRFLSPRTQQQPRDPVTGETIPPLLNAYTPNTPFDLYVYLSTNSSSSLADLRHTSTPVWFLPSERYAYDRRLPSRYIPSPIQYQLSDTEFDALLHQHHRSQEEKTVSVSSVNDTNERPSVIGTTGRVLDSLSGISKLRRLNERRKSWKSVHLLAFAVPHTVYEKSEASQELPPPLTLDDAVKMLRRIENLGPDSLEHIARGKMNLIEYMKPIGPGELQSLLSYSEEDRSKETVSAAKNGTVSDDDDDDHEPHWKNHIDIRMVVDASPLNPQSLATPHLQRFIVPLPEEGVYIPVLHPSDMWLLERNYILLNETLRNQPLNLTLSFNGINMLWWSVQAQLGELWNPSGEGPVNPLMALQTHSKRETFMLKRVILDTNPYVLAFSGAFMALHTLFSFLAFKNDIQFWHRNESMEGLSVLTIVFNFVCEIVIALYLYDSEETSFLILFEIFIGLALSAWKVTKAVNVSLKWTPGRWCPTLQMDDKKEESETKKYDRVAIRFMSMLLLPCMLGYAAYALKYKKFKSWYSYVISTLAGTVYTFGFITMTPQLYINYKLKSVDHLPWRAFTYKALNTFVDDIAAFIIDMPWMHRLACFRDDVIFLCYLYQRWVYSVDKTRPSEWVAPASEDKVEAIDAGDGTAPPTTEEPEDTTDVVAPSSPTRTVRQRKNITRTALSADASNPE